MRSIQFSEESYLELYPDVADAVKLGKISSGWEHYQLFGQAEKRHLKYLSPRQVKVMTDLNLQGVGLEIGPSHNPIAPKREGYNVHILDHASASELKEKYKDHNVQVENIEEVDFVWSGERLPELIGSVHSYDWIIASHVIEHTPDLIAFIRDCENLLKPGGVLALVVPDKRYCFDSLSNVTLTGEVLDAHQQNRTRPSPGKVFDHFANASSNLGRIAWDKATAHQAFELVHKKSDALEQYLLAIQEPVYIDVHNWRFTPNSFRLMFSDLKELKLTALAIASLHDTIGCEFYVHLTNNAEPNQIERLELLSRLNSD
jgi:SAM-dependent methyltransferase